MYVCLWLTWADRTGMGRGLTGMGRGLTAWKMDTYTTTGEQLGHVLLLVKAMDVAGDVGKILDYFLGVLGLSRPRLATREGESSMR